jgi:nucleoside-diphosphate-sugar epimerase
VKKILITGMSGLIGGVVRRRLQGQYSLTALNRSEVPGVQTHRADIADFDAIRPAFEGQEVVIHLAAIASGTASWEEVLQANVIGTRNVFEAAQQAGVQRVIYASSGATVAGWEREFPYGALVNGDYDVLAPLLLEWAGVQPSLPTPEDVEVTQRWQGDRRLMYLLNHAAEPRTVHLDGDYTDLLEAETRLTGRVEIEPYGVRLVISTTTLN